MIARAGTCVTLSLAIVVLASVVLHRPDRRSKAGEVPSASKLKGPERTWPSVAPADAERARPKPSEQPIAASPIANRPKAAFERVRDGETFADVARRVYGEGADLTAFWKVNRDQMASPEAEVRAGMVLRTPDL